MTATEPGAARNLSLIRWLTCLMFFTFAMTTDAVGSVIPKIIEQFALSLTALKGIIEEAVASLPDLTNSPALSALEGARFV